MNRKKLAALFFVLAVLVALPTLSALAQGSQPPSGDSGSASWGSFFAPDGSMLPGVTDMGVVYQDASWMPNLSWAGINMQAEYHQYVAADGSTMLMPTQTTFFLARCSPDSPFYSADAWIGAGGAAQVNFNAGSGTTLDRLWSLVTGFATPGQQMDTSISGAFVNWSLFGLGDSWQTLQGMAGQSWQDGNLYMNALLFSGCAGSPGGCPPEVLAALATATATATDEPIVPDDPSATPPPPAVCPAPSVSQAAPSMSIGPGDPPYPLVVGQDPEKRGADVFGQITLPPVIVTWYEPVYEDDLGCVGPMSPGEPPCSRGRVETVTYLSGCIAHHDAVPEQIVAVTGTATLSEASRNWIINDLGSRWYGAYVHQGSFNLMQFGNSGASCGGDGTCRAVIDARGVPFADPGKFDLLLRISTNGAFWNGQRITAPRSLSVTGELGVSAILPTLIDASTRP